MRKTIIKSGDRFGRLTAVKFIEMRKNFTKYWLFRCECGNEKVMMANNVKNGHTKSCGCLGKHGMSNTRVYNSWNAMKRRCYNKNDKDYKRWGGRGITVCDEWLSFINFYSDMGERPEKMTLDRINNDLGYSKENCKWSTQKEQTNNTRRNVFLTFNNKTLTVSQWAEELEISKFTLFERIRRNWNIEKILSSQRFKKTRKNCNY